jgi:hemerythrin
MNKVEWSPTFAVGVRELDDEHRELFNLVGEAGNAIEARDYSRYRVLSGRFVDGLERHFAKEEAFLIRIGFPAAQRHQAYHASLMTEAQALKKTCDGPEDDRLLHVCYERILKCLMDDTLRGDLGFKSYVDYHGHKDATRAAQTERRSSPVRERPKS